MVLKKLYIGIILLFLLDFYTTESQGDLTVETLDNPAPGYILLDSFIEGYLTIIDNSGFMTYKKSFNNIKTANTFSIQQNGLLTFYANSKFYVINSNFILLDSFAVKNSLLIDPHDFKLTNEGHAFFLCNEYDTVDMSIIVPGGKPNAVLRSSVIQEQDGNKNVVWEWNTIDHYKVTDATSSVDLTQQNVSWVHTNSIEFDNDGNVLVSSRDLDEITKINKQTGDIIWRLGGKECKNNQFTFLNDTVDGFWGFSHQHSINLLPNGNLLLFDNGTLKPTQYSRAVEYKIDELNKTVQKVWEYKCSPDLFSISQGSVQRLPNGNTVIGWGANIQQITFTEVTPDGSIAMEAKNFPSYKVMRYPLIMASKLILVQNNGNYSFSDTSNETGVSLNISGMTVSGYISVERHYYTPHIVSYEGLPPFKTYGHRWVLNNKGISQFTGKIIFKLSEIDSLDSPQMDKIYWRKNEGNGSFKELETTFNQTQGTLEANISSFGEFIIAEPQVYQIPLLIAPADSSKKNPTVLDLIWRNVIGADSYRLQVSENKNFTLNLVDSLITSDTSFILTGLENNKTYYWRSKSFYDSNESYWSNPWAFTTLLKSPELIEPADGETDFPVRGLFEWDSVAGAEYYKINISKTPEFDSIFVDETGITDTSYSFAVFDFARNYYWRVKAMNLDNESIWSDTNTFTTEKKEVLVAPVLLYPANDTTDVPLYGFLYWNPAKNADSYNLELSLYSDFHKNIVSNKGIGSTSHYYSELKYDTTYYWHVSSVNMYDTSAWSDTWNFRTQKIEDVADNNTNELYLKIDMEGNIIIQSDIYTNMAYFTIIDITGRVILSQKLLQIPIIISSEKLNRGIYFYKISTNGNIFKGKILIY
ncbi:MAG: hypothetical protein A2X61_15960 [Ignavibacteria bacterium GWB2_35_12]|nr:MAG: hypothetical protein A2X63_07235 [Ignavibacteria bacterium GWA2_35_8]OGU40867.1 MAG: hypothetical protein A2X61_15960 [Ignavibacteria bacterium GWB2_35_12]OGV20133.1 MAG: hypothetical protein A2475_14740 [Ignavibacteria bacterium RIFOXYC2_FULL_35_21]